MLFNSLEFLFLFLPIVLALSRALRGKWLLGWVAVASYVFYAFAGHVWFLVPMLLTTAVDFELARRIEAAAPGSRRRRVLLIVSLTSSLGLLAYFKYGGLLARTTGQALALAGAGPAPAWVGELFDVLLPAGISFYTFQTLAYVVDVYRGHCKAERDFWTFTCFVSFFPHLVAGPLTRHHQLIPGLERMAEEGLRPRWREGLFLFAIGLCKKVLVADRIAHVIDPLLLDVSHAGAVEAWLAMLGFALQIYFDFSGYTDMAIGLGRLFGIELPQNFDSPYQARDPSDFWRRWHITLSQWLRDYLYISLGGNRCSPARRHFNLVVTMVLGGLWHGANWTFAAWGLYHGLLLVAFHQGRVAWERLAPSVQRALTFLLVCVGWVFFRATSFTQASAWLSALVGGRGAGLERLGAEHLALALLVALGLYVAGWRRNASHATGLGDLSPSRQAALGALAGVAVLLFSNGSRFLYFQF
jgi:alginate O-acetyltransferase complex protein AlgI